MLVGPKLHHMGQANSTGMPPDQKSMQSCRATLSLYKLEMKVKFISHSYYFTSPKFRGIPYHLLIMIPIIQLFHVLKLAMPESL